jgi:hypothetical protein
MDLDHSAEIYMRRLVEFLLAEGEWSVREFRGTCKAQNRGGDETLRPRDGVAQTFSACLYPV